ncbi:MAG: LCP family protein [Chloroflexota bacterium]|nr:LCP family protein [Chloroflexota bacterium]
MRGLGLGIVVLLLLVAGGGAWAAYQLARTSTRPLDLQAPPARQNVLVLGFGGGSHPGAYLSDAMIVISETGAGTAEISIPRDLWVQLPPNSGRYAKINEALQDGYNSGGLPAGAELAAVKAGQVLGLPVTGWVLEDFQGFRRLIDAAGGVDVDVERAFTARYPVNDDPSVDASWKTVHFDAGRQHLDGERALEYARARYSTDPKEGTDFARSARQQRLTTALRRKVLSPAGAWRFFPVVGATAAAMRTNLSAADMAAFFLGFRAEGAKHITLDTSNVLVESRSANGQDILLPRGNNYQAIASYVKSQLP